MKKKTLKCFKEEKTTRGISVYLCKHTSPALLFIFDKNMRNCLFFYDANTFLMQKQEKRETRRSKEAL